MDWQSYVSGCLLLVSMGCHTQNYTQHGAAVGGLGGAGIGAMIGEVAADEPLAGAAIGTAVGALTGATVGSALDEVDQRNEHSLVQATHLQSASGVSIEDVVEMTTAGLQDNIITRQIQTQGYSQPLSTADLIALRQQGVLDRVIASLQEASVASVAVAPPHVPPGPPAVIVEERFHPRPFYRPFRRHRHHGVCPPGPGFRWGFTFAN